MRRAIVARLEDLRVELKKAKAGFTDAPTARRFSVAIVSGTCQAAAPERLGHAAAALDFREVPSRGNGLCGRAEEDFGMARPRSVRRHMEAAAQALRRAYTVGAERTVVRGVSWNNNTRNVRASNRNRNEPTKRNNNIGSGARGWGKRAEPGLSRKHGCAFHFRAAIRTRYRADVEHQTNRPSGSLRRKPARFTPQYHWTWPVVTRIALRRSLRRGGTNTLEL